MPTAQVSWREWHLTDNDSMNACAEEIYGMTPSFRSGYQRMRDDQGNEVRELTIFPPLPELKNVSPAASIGMWVIVVGGSLQVLTDEQYAVWRAALNG